MSSVGRELATHPPHHKAVWVGTPSLQVSPTCKFWLLLCLGTFEKSQLRWQLNFTSVLCTCKPQLGLQVLCAVVSFKCGASSRFTSVLSICKLRLLARFTSVLCTGKLGLSWLTVLLRSLQVHLALVNLGCGGVECCFPGFSPSTCKIKASCIGRLVFTSTPWS